MKTTAPPTTKPDHVRVNVRIPAKTHRLAKSAAVLLGITLEDAVALALEEWTRSRQQGAQR